MPLIELMSSIKATLDPLVGKPLSVTAIVDIMNKVGAPAWSILRTPLEVLDAVSHAMKSASGSN